ncbi:hypothetical protein PG993_012118 [Apiospora rasikravindrae]|uniref:Uncharacterized protein n=1 Tax=Apiospora rasikravindrae TaxID=990691 RepID=A0ABR1S2W5_9PEZI
MIDSLDDRLKQQNKLQARGGNIPSAGETTDGRQLQGREAGPRSFTYHPMNSGINFVGWGSACKPADEWDYVYIETGHGWHFDLINQPWLHERGAASMATLCTALCHKKAGEETSQADLAYTTLINRRRSTDQGISESIYALSWRLNHWQSSFEQAKGCGKRSYRPKGKVLMSQEQQPAVGQRPAAERDATLDRTKNRLGTR